MFMKGIVFQTMVSLYNHTFEQERLSRFPDAEILGHFKPNHLMSRFELSFSLSKRVLQWGFYLHNLMDDVLFIFQQPKFLAFMAAKHIAESELLKHSNYFTLRHSIPGSERGGIPRVVSDSRERTIDLIIEKLHQIIVGKLPSRWILCHECDAAGCMENMFVIDGIEKIHRATCCVPPIFLSRLAFLSEQTANIFRVCADDPIRGLNVCFFVY